MKKEYSNDTVTIVWQPELCIHSGICARGLAEVFQPREKPWIKPNAASASAIIAQVKKCPSGALSYYESQFKPTQQNQFMDYQMHRNEDKKRFELEVDGHTALIEYLIDKDRIMYLTHTEVPPSLEGKGVGKTLVAQTLQYMRDNDFKLAPLCPFVAAYLKRNPDWQSLLAPNYHVA